MSTESTELTWSVGLAGTALEIARATEKHLLVAAGPGTGKTTAMKRRIMRLLQEGVGPDRILAVTFTRTAASDMVREMRSLGVPGAEDIKAGTLHAYCFGLLRRDSVLQHLGRGARMLISFNQKKVMKFEGAPLVADIIRAGLATGKREVAKTIKAFEAAWARNQSEEPGWPENVEDAQLHDYLNSWMRFHGSMLVGELIPEAYKYLRDNPACSERNAFDYVVVDEYQDLNKAEQCVIDLLSEQGNLAVVGDEDQSIYRFRHAHPEGIIEFPLTHDPTREETLDTCHRCPKTVVAMADSVIRVNHAGSANPRLRPEPTRDDGNVAVVQWQSLDQEIAGVIAYVKHLTDTGVNASEILILCPRRLIGYAIRDGLAAQNIDVHSFYHEESLEEDRAQYAFALLSLLASPSDRVSLRFLLGFGSPSWNAGEYATLREHCETNGVAPWDALVKLNSGAIQIAGVKRILARFQTIVAELDRLRPLSGADLLNALFPSDEDWAAAARDIVELKLDETTTAEAIMHEIAAAVTQPEMPENGDYVRIMSLHKSKGLTARAVIVCACIEGLIPHVDDEEPLSEQEAILREQRRLFYVSLTRTKQHLLLSSTTQLSLKDAYTLGAKFSRKGPTVRTIASRFLSELGPRAPRAITGQQFVASLNA